MPKMLTARIGLLNSRIAINPQNLKNRTGRPTQLGKGLPVSL
jgi:hypothetical protein